MDTYEKKYNEALNWMRELYPGLHGATKEDAEHFFPELRESEDERVRRCIGMALTDVDEQRFKDFGTTLKDCLAWLEKQKPAEWSEVELEFRGEKVTVKRPFYRDNKGRGYSTAELDEDVAWNALRAWCEKKGISLYDLYPKAEWSEEDEKKIHFLSRLIEFQVKDGEYCFGEGACAISKQEAIEMLQSLRPQPSWKPSEELLDALYIVANLPELEFYGGIKDKIRELYKQLKKL